MNQRAKPGRIGKVICFLLCCLTALLPAAGLAGGGDRTGEQYAFLPCPGVNVPEWNAYRPDGTPAGNAAGVVAVLDSGIDYEHEDLRDVIWTEGMNYPELVEMGGTAYGFDAIENKSVMDRVGHGTHVAGIIAAAWNGTGVSGAASGIRIMAVRTTDEGEQASLETVLSGLEYVLAAKRAGVNVLAVNLSWGGSVQNGVRLDAMCRKLGEAGVVTVIAAGNHAEDLDGTQESSAWTAANPYVLVVGNSTKEAGISPDSSYGLLSAHLFAPGDRILSTLWSGYCPNREDAEISWEDEDGIQAPEAAEPDAVGPNAYGEMSGTSMAAPAVTGCVAITASRYPEEAADRIVARILGSVRKVEAFEGKCVTGGLADLEGALGSAILPVPQNAQSTDRELLVTGHFFGDEAGRLSVDGKEAKVLSWSDTEIRAEASGEFNRRRAGITVETRQGRQMGRIFDLTDSTGPLRNLPLEGQEGLFAMDRTGLTALKGDLFVSGTNSPENSTEIWKITGGRCSCIYRDPSWDNTVQAVCPDGENLILVRDLSLEVLSPDGSILRKIQIPAVDGFGGRAACIGDRLLFLENTREEGFLLRLISLPDGREISRTPLASCRSLLGFAADGETAAALVSDPEDHCRLITFSLQGEEVAVRETAAEQLETILNDVEWKLEVGFTAFRGQYWIFHKRSRQDAMLFPLAPDGSPDLSAGYAVTAGALASPLLAAGTDGLYALAASPTQIRGLFLRKLSPEASPAEPAGGK